MYIHEPAIYIALTLVCANILHAAVHSVLAKLMGLRIDEVSIFYFGRTLHPIGNGVLRVGWLPFGAYVAPAGMPIDAEMEEAMQRTSPLPYEYRSRPLWQRVLFSLSSVGIMAIGVLLCIKLANSQQVFSLNFTDWLQQVELFFEFIFWQRSPKDFVDALFAMGSRSLLFYTGASWLSLFLASALMPTGVVGRAIWRFFGIYNTKVGAAFTLIFVVFTFLAWVYMLLMMAFMLIKIYSVGYLIVFILNFLATAAASALIIRWVANKLGKNAA